MICKIIGVLDSGVQGLTPDALSAIQTADRVIGASRTLNLFAEHIAKPNKKI